jgi:hypothetical protein
MEEGWPPGLPEVDNVRDAVRSACAGFGPFEGSPMSMPMTTLGKLPVSRLVIGGNPVSGFSHGSPARDQAMFDYFTTANCKKLLRRCEECGVNTAFFRADNHVIRLFREYWNEGGKIQWVAQTVPGEDPVGNIRKAHRFGAKGVYLHGGTLEAYFSKGEKETVHRQLETIKELGLPAGCAAHYPPYLLEIEERGWAPDFYMVCLYHIEGYKGQLGVEQNEKFRHEDRPRALEAIRKLPRPCFAYKILAAGRLNPREAFHEVFSALKPTDGVNVGMFPPDAKSGDIVAENAGYVSEFAR